MEAAQWTELFTPKCPLENTGDFTVYEAQERLSGRLVLLTVSPGSQSESVGRRKEVMKKLMGIPGVPQVIWEGKGAFAVEDVGSKLSDMVEKTGPLEEAIVLRLGVSVLRTLEAAHHREYLHLNLHSSCIRLSGEKDCYVHGWEGAQRMGTAVSAPGTRALHFASSGYLRGEPLGAKDDLESLSYLFLYAFTGSLPWIQAKGPSEILAIRKATSCDQLLSAISPVFAYFHSYVTSLSSEDRPHYHSLRRRLLQKMGRQGATEALTGLWVRKKYNRRASDPLILYDETLTAPALAPKLSLPTTSTLEHSDTVKTLRLPILPSHLREMKRTL